jgi:hypothetical protein
VLGLVKAFLKAGVLSEDGVERDTLTGTPQGGILSPLLSNIALSVLDEHFAAAWEAMGDTHAREQRRRKGLANYKLVRYADDFVVLVAGERVHAECHEGGTPRRPGQWAFGDAVRDAEEVPWRSMSESIGLIDVRRGVRCRRAV